LWRLDRRYLSAAALLLLIEIFIALRVDDAWIRPHGGDVLAVIFLYCLVRVFLNLPVVPTALGVLAFSFVVETLQYLRFVERIGLTGNRLVEVVLGTSFEWLDLACYALGAALVLLYEWTVSVKQA
jgi:hypothetical protein